MRSRRMWLALAFAVGVRVIVSAATCTNGPGFSSFVSADISGAAYVWAYRASDGMVCIDKILVNGAGFDLTWQYKWDLAFSGFASAGGPYVWAYRGGDGMTAIHEVKNGIGAFTQRYLYKWDRR